MIFPDYKETKVVYHVAPITDLEKILKNGIKYDDKKTYKSKYLNFHKYIDLFQIKEIPAWVVREKAIFASFNFTKDHCWHSHSVLLQLRIDPNKCWVANENLANKIYEPFILKGVKDFEEAQEYLNAEGTKALGEYWESSLSFNENLKERKDLQGDYDAEILIFHDILPEDIMPLSIVSDHMIMSIEEWKKFLKGGLNCGNRKNT